MLIRGLLFGLGLLLLYGGAEALVRGASRLARDLGVSAVVVGLTVVAFGTSMPELVVSLLAVSAERSDVAIGNVVGSNIANIALILGLSALICPLRVESRLVGREIPLMILVSAAFVAMTLDRTLGRLDAALLLLGFVGYLALVLRSARAAPPGMEAAYAAFDPTAAGGSRLRDLGMVALGLAGLIAGAHLLVDASVWFARHLGVPELLVGLTVVAVGTSLPELATSAVAAFRRETDIAVGNIVGSNLFNILAILGVSGTVRPLRSELSLLRFEFPVMLGVAALLLPLAWSRFEIQRWEGAVLVTGYAVFLYVLVARAMGAG